MKNPKLISKPFAQNGQKNVIPEKYETSMESNQATWDQGFGQITMLPVSAGGLPPKGQDFNGILNQMCETIVHISKGGVFKFSADYAVAINGYPKGAILQSEDEKKYYQSLIDNNKVNFNTASQDQIKTSWKLVMTDDLLAQLSKKLESSAVVQSTGSSTTSVMSQKASTDAFQPKGSYFSTSGGDINGSIKVISNGSAVVIQAKSDDSSIYMQGRDSTGKALFYMGIPTDGSKNLYIKNYISGAEISLHENGITLHGDSYISGKLSVQNYASFDARYIQNNAVVQSTGASTTSVMSQKASTDAFQAKGSYANKGDSYTKSESDARYQGKGNYQPAGNYALVGASYTKEESNNLYQSKGDYADKSSLYQQKFSSGISAKGEVFALNDAVKSSVGLKVSLGFPSIVHSIDDTNWHTVRMQEKSGVMALLTDIENSELVPHPIPWSLLTAPTGYLICQGQTFNKATYPKLAIAYPSGKLPDIRGNAIRGLDAGRGIDADRQILSEQAGNSLLSSPIMDNAKEKGFGLKINNIGRTGGDNQGWNDLYQQIEGANGNETRMRNIAFLYIVRAA